MVGPRGRNVRPADAERQDLTMYDDIAQRYIDAWNQCDPAARRAAVDDLYTEDARYIDPLAVAEGKEAITATIGAVQQQIGRAHV